MAKHTHVHVHRRTKDAGEFKESDHPRADNWQFGSGGGGTKPAAKQAPTAKAAKAKKESPAVTGPILLTKKQETLAAAADAIATMPEEKRDNTQIGDFPGGASGYNLYEARKMLPKPADKLKRVTESNSFSLWQNYDYVANVDGELYGVTKQEDPDDVEDDLKFVYEFERIVDPYDSSVTTITDQTDELFSEMCKARSKLLEADPNQGTQK